MFQFNTYKSYYFVFVDPPSIRLASPFIYLALEVDKNGISLSTSSYVAKRFRVSPPKASHI